MGKLIASTKLSPTLTLSECSDGWWLYDHTRGMNLSIKAKSPTEAFIEALTYYQGRLSKVERQYQELDEKVLTFVEQFVDKDE